MAWSASVECRSLVVQDPDATPETRGKLPAPASKESTTSSRTSGASENLARHEKATSSTADSCTAVKGSQRPPGFSRKWPAWVSRTRTGRRSGSGSAPLGITSDRLGQVGPVGEALISEAAYTASGSDLGDLERRELSVKGRDAPPAVRTLGPNLVLELVLISADLTASRRTEAGPKPRFSPQMDLP